MNTVSYTLLLVVLAGVCGSQVASAQEALQGLARATLEELMDIRIISASRKEQSISDTAAAVSVITSDDIRRSGATTLPDALRLAPGVQVLRLDSNKWAISARGIGSVYSHMLLVLIDGRSVYNRALSTTTWDMQDLVLEDVERIEVIRGPGASVWGANAVNGVVNIITKSASATRGTMVQARGGSLDGAGLTARHGGRLGGGNYRVFLQESKRRGLLTAAGERASDDWNVLSTGFRMDFGEATDSNFSLQGGAMTNGIGTVGAPDSSSHSTHLLATAVRQFSGDSQLALQAFVSHENRQDPLMADKTTTIDADLKYRTRIGKRNDVVTGVGYRRIGNTLGLNAPYAVDSPHVNDAVLNLYAQDEITLAGERLRVTVGSKLEHDSTSGFGLQPTGRVLWSITRRQQVWASMSRALHSPGRLVRDLTWEIPPTFDPVTNFFYGFKASDNPNLKYETALSRELGYRVELADKVWVDFAGYLNKYDDMLIFEFSEAGLQFVPVPHLLVNYQIGNALKYETKGLEITTRWAPLRDWQLEGSWAWVDVKKEFDVASAFFPADDTVPANTFTVRSRSSLGSRVTLDGSATYVSRMAANLLVGPSSEAVDSYTRVDANIDWRLTPDVSLAATGQNLLGTHTEATGTLGFAYTVADEPRAALSIPRNLGLSLRWRF